MFSGRIHPDKKRRDVCATRRHRAVPWLPARPLSRVSRRGRCVAHWAHLQLGRAYAVAGDKTRAKTAYQDFLTLWKDADPDIPVLQQAKAEYSRLK